MQLTASVNGVEQRIPLQVTAPTLTALAIGNLRPLTVGESSTLTLSGRSEAGTLDDATLGAMGLSPRWSSSAPEVARIDARTGQLRAVAPGTCDHSRGRRVALGERHRRRLGGDRGESPRADSRDAGTSGGHAADAAAPAARSESDVSREIEGALREYASAVSARDLNAMLKVFPTMGDKDKATWRQFFRDGTDVTYKLVNVQLNRPVDLGESAKVTLTRNWSLAFTLARTQQAMGPTSGSDRVTMSRAGGSWHITQIQ